MPIAPFHQESCPTCGSNEAVVAKLVLVAERSPVYGVDISEGGRWPYQLAVDECTPDALRGKPLQQFIDGLYCQNCDLGFVPVSFLRQEGE